MMSKKPETIGSTYSFLPRVAGAEVVPTKRPTGELIAEECDAIKQLLLEKNAKYGNSAFAPARIFSKASPEEQLLVRIDDKLSRLRTLGTGVADEDTVQDLIGYLILLRVARKSK